MDCKEFMHVIPNFLNREMDYSQLKEFCLHANQCENCKEELTIQFLVSEGISHLEAGDAFDLNKELSNRMTNSNQALKNYESKRNKARILQAVGAMLIVASIVSVFIPI